MNYFAGLVEINILINNSMSNVRVSFQKTLIAHVISCLIIKIKHAFRPRDIRNYKKLQTTRKDACLPVQSVHTLTLHHKHENFIVYL